MTTDEQGFPKRPPVPVDRLIDAAIKDGSDFHDGLMGYVTHRFDQESGTLDLVFERDHDAEAYPSDDWSGAVYRFKMI